MPAQVEIIPSNSPSIINRLSFCKFLFIVNMKFSIAAVTSFVAAAVAASLPDAFTLVANGGKTLVTDGSK